MFVLRASKVSNVLKSHRLFRQEQQSTVVGPLTTMGFTLIELLIVVAVIGIIAAIAIPMLSAYRQKAYNSAAQTDIINFKFTMQAYFVENHKYPDIIL